MKDKKKITNWNEVMKWIFIYLLFVALGFILGMAYQQVLFTQGIMRVLDYSDIEVNVNLNTTKLVEEMNKTFIPAWKEAFNQTVTNQLNLTGGKK